jgi:hypothetical protein
MFGQDFVEIEHFDEGINASEITYQKVFYDMKAEEEEKASRKKGR